MLSHLSMDMAAKLITSAVRYHGHLRSLQIKCRKKFRRYILKSYGPPLPAFSAPTHQTPVFYYYNTIYGTTSWRKPYCMRLKPLVPYYTDDEAASLIQGLYRMYQARLVVNPLLRKQFVKIFDRKKQHFYYAYIGKSKIPPKSRWRKPYYMHRSGFIKDIIPIFSDDIAAIRIQNLWRFFVVSWIDIKCVYLFDWYYSS